MDWLKQQQSKACIYFIAYDMNLIMFVLCRLLFVLFVNCGIIQCPKWSTVQHPHFICRDQSVRFKIFRRTLSLGTCGLLSVCLFDELIFFVMMMMIIKSFRRFMRGRNSKFYFYLDTQQRCSVLLNKLRIARDTRQDNSRIFSELWANTNISTTRDYYWLSFRS